MSNYIEEIASQNPENLAYVKSIYNDNTTEANTVISLSVTFVAQKETQDVIDNLPIGEKTVYKLGILNKYGTPSYIDVVVDLSTGTTPTKAFFKGLTTALSVYQAEIAIAAAFAGSAVALPFALLVGGAVIGYVAGKVASSVYDKIIGPDFKYEEETGLITVNYTLKDAMSADTAFWNDTIFQVINGNGLHNEWILESDNGGEIKFEVVNSVDTFTFVGKSLASLKENESIMDLTIRKMHASSDFSVNINGTRHSVINLLLKSQSEIASLSRSDSTVMYALANLKSYAFNENSPSSVDFTDEFIQDKSTMLYWYNRSKIEGIDSVNAQLAFDDTYYEDKVSKVILGENFQTGLDYYKKIIFGTDGVNRISGNNDTDRLYGMGGNDVLTGGGGSDILYGGKNNDVLIGGYGINDDDNVSDTLNGGLGYDTYRAGNSDIIKDTDGIGKIFFEGVSLSGEKTMVEDSNGYTYHLQNPNGAGTLTITENIGGKYILVEDFTNGNLGISLKDTRPIEITIYAPIVKENSTTATGSVVLSQIVTKDTTVILSTQDDTATAGDDFVANNNIEAIVKAGTSYATFEVEIINDNIVEPTESFYTIVESVSVDSQDVEFIVNDLQAFTIEDDDSALEITIHAPIVQENSSIATGSIVLSKDVTQDTIITLYTQSDTAIAGDDFVANSSIEVTVTAGSNYATFEVEILDDNTPEPTESFYVLVGSVKANSQDVAYTINDVQAFSIEDNDSNDTLALRVYAPTVQEDSGMATGSVVFSQAVTQDTVVTLSTQANTATAGDDFVANNNIKAIVKAGTSYATFEVEILDNDEAESTESFYTIVDSVKVNSQNVEFTVNELQAFTIEDDDNDTKATPNDDILILTDKNDTMDALAGDDYVEGKGGDDILIGNTGNDILWGGSGNDSLYGDSGSDILFGDSGDDYLDGGADNDTLYGGTGDDVLLGSGGADYLNGGSGFDYYISDNGDVVEDSDGRGAVIFNNSDISGRKGKIDGSDNTYEDDDNYYVDNGGSLSVVSKTSDDNIIIQSWSNKDLGIELVESEDIEVSVGDAEELEAAEMYKINVELHRPLNNDEQLVVDIGYYYNIYETETVEIPAQEASYTEPVTTKRFNNYTQTWSSTKLQITPQ